MTDSTPTAILTIDGMLSLKELFTSQIGRFGDKVDNLNSTVERGFIDIRKIVDDHEQRLRKQYDVDSAQAKDVSDLRVEMQRQNGNIEALRAQIGEVVRMETRRASREMDFWQRAALAVFQYGAFGAAAGGVVAGVLHAVKVF